MKYHLFRYTCANCSEKFTAPEIGHALYGEFLMRSVSGDTVHLNGITDSVYAEVGDLLDRLPIIKGLDDFQKADTLMKVFGVACDLDSLNARYGIMNEPKCPNCGETKSSYWESTEPPEYIELDFQVPTHIRWSKLTIAEKKGLLVDAISECIEKD